MTVRELIDYLYKCDETLPVRMEFEGDVDTVVEHIDHTDPKESHVNLM